ncbi:hypothetical protein A1O7_07503 [Cladophialophora yegresii CBS 114405]|uniref:Uncharacterized protein n=1 Tax=Cladophialophora yegresii CBS 114405 TaxID=1182544 RepID=W9VNP4_9EURO|nr:uncharacterized protein A1O7_07503 [Cladophialophora yegresii CBS 114405]EXJ57158.1 hypothetical protein A1O7_07503 [Cladophialophora yegresii CBS 114405]
MTLAYDIALMGMTGVTAQTQFTRFDERWDVSMLLNDIRVQRYSSWLNGAGGPIDEQWIAVKRNWINFLSATSTRPDATLAPTPNATHSDNEQPSGREHDIERFHHDRRVRAAIQVAIFNAFDREERLAERWPQQARLILNRAGCSTATQPFRTLRATADLGKRRRYQAVWASLVCFLVFAHGNQDMLDEMGLVLAEHTEDEVIDILAAIDTGIQSELDAAVRVLCVNMITDHAPTASKNPLFWWLTVLVRSAIEPLQEMDYISRGRFLMNILSMDLDLCGRLEAIQHYAKVLVLDKALDLWRPYSDDWALQVNRDLDAANLDWLDEGKDQPLFDEDDPRTCDSSAWRSMLENLNRWALAYLSTRKDIDTVLGEVGKLLSTEGC